MMTFRRVPIPALAVLGVAAVVIASWAWLGRDEPDASRRVFRATVSPIPDLALAAKVQVTAPDATEVVIRHGPDLGYGTETRTVAVPSTGTLSTAIIGLPAGEKSHVEVVAHYGDGGTRTSGDLTVTTPPLPPGVPSRLAVQINKGLSTGVVMFSMNGEEEIRGLALIADRLGRVLWYRRCGGGPFDFQRLPNGRLLLHQAEKQAFEEIELDGTVVRTWTDPKSLTGADEHDFVMLPNGNALILAAEAHEVDTSAIFPGGQPHSIRWDDTVSEIAPSGMVLWRWSSWSRISEAEITDDPKDPLVPRDYEVVHANSADPQPDGTVLLSLRNIGALVKVDPRTGDIVWRLGGKRSDFRIEGDPLGGFHRQHDARLVGPDRILLFDNGNFHDPPESRVVEYRIDEKAKTATLVWQHRRSPPLFTPMAGSTQRLPNGHTLISYGPRGRVSEVDPSGTVVWEVRARGFGVYRARSFATAYP